MKKTGILNARLIGELTGMRHTDKIVICDAGFPVPEGKALVDVSLVAGLPTVPQVLRAVCNEIIIESLTLNDGLKKLRPDFYEELVISFPNHEISEISIGDFFRRVYDDDVKLFIRTGDVLPCGNILLSSASGSVRVFEKYNVEFENVIG